jgi:hypothetical protein
VRAAARQHARAGRARFKINIRHHRLLFTVVITLFGLMNLGAAQRSSLAPLRRAAHACCCAGAAVGFVLDRRERASVTEQLHDPACGFRVTGAGTYLWRFALNPLPEELAAPSGPAVELALVLGMPFSRLRMALPDELFTTDVHAAFGRRHGFSAAGMIAHAPLHKELLSKPRKSQGTRRLSAAVRVSISDPAPVLACEPAPQPCAAWCSGAPPTVRMSLASLAAAAAEEDAEPEDPSDLRMALTQDSRVALEEFIGTGASRKLRASAPSLH